MPAMERNEMTIVPMIPDINPDKLIKMNAGNGDFYVCSAGARANVPTVTFYGDDAYQFLVFSKYILSEGKLIVNIFGISTRLFGGQTPRIPAADLNVIKDNLTFLFLHRNMNFLNKETTPDGTPSAVTFTWSVE
jgi:hypothetical protein